MPTHQPLKPVAARRRRTLTCALVTLLAAATLTGCGQAEELPAAPEDPSAQRAVRYLTRVQGELDPMHLALVSWIGRSWGWTELLGLRDRAASEARDGLDAGYEANPELAALARIPLPNERKPLVDARTVPIGETSVAIQAALYCDTTPLRSVDADLLRQLSRGVGYDPTHALLASLIAMDIGCDDPLWSDVKQTSMGQVAAELAERQSSSPRLDAIVDDLSLEQTALLAEAGRRDVLASDWMAAIRAAQLGDGGWAQESYTAGNRSEAVSAWHATLLALWSLSASSSPGNNVGLPGTS
jgi:hypothetical protein